MRVGLTYDLRDDYRALGGFSETALAEFDSPETIDALDHALSANGCHVDRVGHIRNLAGRLVAGESWDLVFNICEGVAGRNREAQVPALLEAYSIPYVFSDPLTLSATLDKAVAKRLVREAGLPTAPFAVVDSDADARTCSLPFPLFVKPLAEGTGKGCERASKVTDRKALVSVARALRARFHQPALAETFLPGREFTVGVVGNGLAARVIATMEIVLLHNADPEVYSFENKELCESRVEYRLADDAEARAAAVTALAAYRTLGCRDGGRLDLRSDANGVPQFLEVNPLAGLHPTHSDLPILAALAGLPYERLIGEILQAAKLRTGVGQVGVDQMQSRRRRRIPA